MKKLKLNKKTIANLSDHKMNEVKGGATDVIACHLDQNLTKELNCIFWERLTLLNCHVPKPSTTCIYTPGTAVRCAP